jgi:hypothetical protein
MKLKELKAIAKQRGIDPRVMKKEELIKAIQRQEGNNDCFGSALLIQCGQLDCLWIEDCRKNNL